MDFNPLQPLNIKSISLTCDVMKLDKPKEFNPEHP